MEQIEFDDPKKRDFAHNWVNSSVFLFYLYVFCITAFVIGGSYALYTHHYKGHPEISVPGNTKYVPEYK